MSQLKKILCVTGSRAEYGILKRLLLRLKEDPTITLNIIATGMHCDPKYGNTYKGIQEDGFEIEQLYDIKIDTSNNANILNSMSLCQNFLGQHFETNKYEAVLILGDRYEIFSVAIAAAMHNLPIIHLHGGEKTLGNYDEFIRHAITKMSKLHLASTEEYKERIIQMGEHPSTVFNIGALGAENSFKLNLPSKIELEKRVGSLTKPYFVVVFHPETLTDTSTEAQVTIVLEALFEFSSRYEFIFIGSNSDTGSEKITSKISSFCKQSNSRYMTSIKPEEYLALNKYSQGLIGNSSSGLIEIPSFKVPTINIGDRQKGRVRGESVLDIKCELQSISEAIEKSQTPEFQKALITSTNPYFQKNVLDQAYTIIKDFIKSNKMTSIKDFYDKI